MRFAKLLSACGIIAMTAALIYGFAVGDFGSDGAKLLGNPWGVVSMVDLYTGFILFSVWIVFREKSIGGAIIWMVWMMVLGFFTASLYVLLALHTSDGDWKRFWMGQRADG